MTKKRQMRYKISMIPETTEQDFEISRNISITVNSNGLNLQVKGNCWIKFKRETSLGVHYFKRYMSSSPVSRTCHQPGFSQFTWRNLAQCRGFCWWLQTHSDCASPSRHLPPHLSPSQRLTHTHGCLFWFQFVCLLWLVGQLLFSFLTFGDFSFFLRNPVAHLKVCFLSYIQDLVLFDWESNSNGQTQHTEHFYSVFLQKV